MLDSAQWISQFPYLGIFLLFILGGLGLPFPEDTTLILCGFLIAHDVIRPLPTFLVIYPALLMTDFFLYLLGKKYGRMLVEHKRFRRLISPERLSVLEEEFKKKGVWVVLVGRHFLGLRAQIFIVAGVMRMSRVKFILADAATALITIAIMVGFGYLGGNSLQRLEKDLTDIKHIVVVVFVIGLAGWILIKYFRKNGKVSSGKRPLL
jgi:membrane protein DedA with SNARE-associated domain